MFNIDNLLKPIMVTMGHHLLVIGQYNGHVYMMSFASPANASIVERDNPSGQHIDLPNRHGEVMDPRKVANMGYWKSMVSRH